MEKTRCSEYTLTEYNLVEKCESDICLAKAKKYGIKTTLAIAVDDRITIEGTPTVGNVKKSQRGAINGQSLYLWLIYSCRY